MVNNKEKNFISAVVYVRNNEDIIRETLERIYKVFSTNFMKFEIICVNDASTDGCEEKIQAFANTAEGCVVSLVNMGFYHGVEASMNAGTDLSIGDFVFEFDSAIVDYDPSLIMEVYRKSLSGYDIVSAKPMKCNRNSSKLFYKIFNYFSGSSFELSTERFRILSRRAINRVDSMSNTTSYRKALYATCGLKLSAISYKNTLLLPSDRNKETTKSRKNTAIDTLVLFTDIAYRISLAFCILMVIFMLCSGIYTVVAYFGRNKPVAGWAPLMGLISAGFFGVFLTLTIVVKYLDLILRLVFKKQKYLISSIKKLK